MMWMVLSLQAQQADLGKLSPWVRRTLAKEQTAVRKAPARKQHCITAFVQTQNGELLTDLGCKTYAQLGDIAIARIPVSQLPALTRQPSILKIEANQMARTLMDTVPEIVNLLPVYEGTALPQAFTGDGVVMGLMDVGFDLTHPTFYSDPSLSHYRISALWDQLSPDTLDSNLPVGRDYIGYDKVRARGTSIDGQTQGHGTHTLGIAAGSGYDTHYRGVAYDSDICLVSNAVTSDTIYIDSLDYDKYTTAVDALGFKYLFDYADQVGKPCVISFSEGYSLEEGINEEDSLFSAFIDKLVGPGHIIVASAGNEGSKTDSLNVLAPGCFPSVICVGATSHRLGHTDYQGQYIDASKGREPGKLSWFSSVGPALNGLMKPDVCAPGDNIISALSSYYLEENPESYAAKRSVSRFELDGRTYGWWMESGTSMSTPVVAGIIALWLQAKPTLTREEIMDVLRRTSHQPDDTLTYPNNRYGYGEIDAYRGLLDILGISKIEAISQHQPEALGIYPKDGTLHLRLAALPSASLQISIYSLAGTLLYQEQLTPATTDVALTHPALSSGVYVLQVSTKDRKFQGSQLVRL